MLQLGNWCKFSILKIEKIFIGSLKSPFLLRSSNLLLRFLLKDRVFLMFSFPILPCSIGDKFLHSSVDKRDSSTMPEQWDDSSLTSFYFPQFCISKPEIIVFLKMGVWMFAQFSQLEVSIFPRSSLLIITSLILKIQLLVFFLSRSKAEEVRFVLDPCLSIILWKFLVFIKK